MATSTIGQLPEVTVISDGATLEIEQDNAGYRVTRGNLVEFTEARITSALGYTPLGAAGGAITGGITVDDSIGIRQATPAVPLHILDGQNKNFFGQAADGQIVRIYHGSDASPVTTLGPTLKVSRTEEIIDPAQTGDMGEFLAAIQGINVGTSLSERQPVGVYGAARTSTPWSGPGPKPDALGIYGAGRSSGGCSGIGGYFVGRRDSVDAGATGTEIQAQNFTAEASEYNAGGSSKTKGIWLVPAGTSDLGVGLQINNPFGAQFEVGIGFGSQFIGGKTGGVREVAIRDDSHASRSLWIRGQHATAAIETDAGAGQSYFGDTMHPQGGIKYYPERVASLTDDFLSGGTAAGQIGALSWQTTDGATSLQAGEAGRPGIVRRSTGGTINTYAVMRLSVLGNGPLQAASFFDLTWLVRLNNNDSDTLVRVGMATEATLNPPPNHGVYIEKLAGDTSWFGVTRLSGSQTRVELDAVTTGWLKVRIRRIGSSTIGFTLDGGAEVTSTTNLPATAANPFVAIHNAVAAAKSIDIDFFGLFIDNLSR